MNRDHISGPRGGAWNASTINGSRTRRNGILQNDLYSGRIVWNRQSFVKDPDTGRRISRVNPREQWMTADAEHLRIVDPETWQAVQARIGERAGRPHKARPVHLLSGLLKCAACGSGYIASSRDKRGVLLACSRYRETGLCDNSKFVARAWVEEKVLAGLEQHLADPEMVAEYVREYHRVSRELAADAAGKSRASTRRSAT